MTNFGIGEKANNIRKNLIHMAYKGQGSHIGCSLSIADILSVLYFKVLKIDPKKPLWSKRDYFILSKGHACSALYACLAERNFFSKSKLSNYLKNGSKISGHATYGSLPGIEATTGSLGHGLSMAIGIAVAKKFEKSKSKVYVLIGDGEAEEGSVWEAIMFAGHYKLNNLVLIIDNNDLQIVGKSSEILNSYPFKKKFESFGWEAIDVNGHSIHDLTNAFLHRLIDRPLAIIANTVKGKGISFMENKIEWHGKSLSKEDYDKAILELNK